MRTYRVVASCFEPDLSMTLDERRESLREHLSVLMKEQSPDLVVVPEVALTPDLHEQQNCGAESIDGPTITYVSELAKTYSANVCMPIVEEDGGKKYNTAVFIDRQGAIAGTYRKHTNTTLELDLGILPGVADPSPVILDGYRVGTALCIDGCYPDILWNYMMKGVDLLVFPAYTYGGRLMSNWAINLGVPVVVAFPWESVIYDRDGESLVDGGTWTTTIRFGNHPAWIAANLNMESRVYHLDFNQPKIKDMNRKYGNSLDVRLMVREARMRLTCTADDLSIQQVEDEMELIPLRTYLLETRERVDRARAEQEQK